MRKGIILVFIIVVVLIAGIGIRRLMVKNKESQWVCQNGNWEKQGNPKEPRPTTGCGEQGTVEENSIRGLEEEHGCQVAAGYNWCPSKEKCQRMWEEYCEEYKNQFRVASFETCVAANNPIIEGSPRQCRAANGEIFKEGIEGSVGTESSGQPDQEKN